VALTIGQAPCQQTAPPPNPNQNPAQQTPNQQTPASVPVEQPKQPLKPNQVDPNGKPSDLPDPTQDPTKNPATDPTRDPTKSPDAAAASPDAQAGADSAGGTGGTVDAPDYTGPAILSRGFALTRPNLAVNQPFTFYAGVNATYDSGLLGAFVQNGLVPSASSEGASFNWGASMLKYRRRSILSFDYSGNYNEYFSNTRFSGQNHSLGAGYTIQLSPRFTIGARETAGYSSNYYSVLNSTAISDVSQASSTIVVAPNTEAFSDRSYYSTTTGSLSYQLTERLSLSIGGAYFLVKRNSQYLADSGGYQTTGDIAYRITRRQTLGVYYSHSAFSYTKIFGDSNSDSLGLNYSISLDRTMDLSIRAGVTRYDDQTLDTVVPNPLVQAVLGIQYGLQKDYFVGYAPDFTVTLNRRLRFSSVGASFTEGISPGNGLVLTSKRQSESIFWNLPTFRQLAMQFGAGHDNLSGYANGSGTAGSYGSYYGRFSLSRPINRVLSAYFNADYRTDGFGGTTFHQRGYSLSLGIRFSPGKGPIKFW
jgi:hypothetical protein